MLSIVLWVVAAIIVYCLLCWIIGFTLTFFGKVHDDLIPGATVYAPLMPIAFLGAFIEEEIIYGIYCITVWWYKRKSKWIAKELQKKGIPLHPFGIGDDFHYYHYNSFHKSCEVQADLKPEDVEIYREVYARAIKKFHWESTPRGLCRAAYPEWPLNREWAKNIGIDEYFAEHFIPCINCDNQRSMGWYWGNDAFHAKPHNETCGYSLKTTYYCSDGTEKTCPGWLCEDCETAHVGPWIATMSGS